MVAFHSRLNRRLWAGNAMRLEVRLRLLRTALAFYRFLDMPGLVLSDIVLTGSNAAFNYTALSDCDLHLIVDYGRTTCPDLAADFFDTKRLLWNQTHDVQIRGHKVEVYVEDRDNPARSSGVYSVLRGEWIKQPSSERPAWDDAALALKTKALALEIEGLLDGNPQPPEVNALLGRLRSMRSSGLMAGGEFSVENLAYKGLRTMGLIGRLMTARREAEDQDLSL